MYQIKLLKLISHFMKINIFKITKIS